MIRAVPLACLATTLVAGQASAQVIGGSPLTPRPSPLAAAGTIPLQGTPLTPQTVAPPAGLQALPAAPTETFSLSERPPPYSAPPPTYEAAVEDQRSAHLSLTTTTTGGASSQSIATPAIAALAPAFISPRSTF